MDVNVVDVSLPAGDVRLEGTLAIPAGARGVVVFAHGSGSGRSSPRNHHVALVLQRAGLATLLVDLLSPAEEAGEASGQRLRFNVELLAHRLERLTVELRRSSQARDLRVGYFGASTGAAAALIAAAEAPEGVGAVVCRGGRPDLSARWLPRVHVPTLFIVGGHDDLVLKLNRDALGHLHAPARLEVIPGATHLFVEPGALDEVARLASRWFSRHLLHTARRWSGSRFGERRFRDRAEAGRMLAGELTSTSPASRRSSCLACRAAVSWVAFEVARALGVTLDVLNVRKLGFPGRGELAFGALSTGRIRVLNSEQLEYVSEDVIEAVTAHERVELERREQLYRAGRPAPDLRGRTVILVDDGVATGGATMRAAIAAIQLQQPARLVVAVPVAPPDTCRTLAAEVDELICLVAPELLFGVGCWYVDFSECSDAAVRRFVERSQQLHPMEVAR